jgi:HD-GYP domain-containing protein (c-di-GMP phosphodiesterase class II)
MNVRTWVYQHHERWDGKGYPQGLQGEDVALPGRILVLAEVYDALAEERSYKPAWPIAKIVALFRDQAGTALRSRPREDGRRRPRTHRQPLLLGESGHAVLRSAR